jgi:hypothetical protein
MPEPQALTERVPLAEAAGGQAPKGRRFRARIIAGDVQGSSGFYPATMLKRDAKVFREGLPVFLDHPGATESYDRPERSVRDLAGKLATTAVYERDGLYADVEVYPHWAPVIEAMAGDIGMSIRASGTVEPSQQEGIRGPIVTSLAEATSVDFVTAAGAGGKIVALLESARAQSGDLLRKAVEAQPPQPVDDLDSDTDDEPDDIDDQDTDEPEEPDDEDDLPKKAAKEARNVGHWLERDLWDDPTPMPAEVFETTATNVPAPPDITNETEVAPMTEGTNAQGTPPDGGTTEVAESAAHAELTEARRQLAEARLQLATIGENAQRATLAEAERDRLKADNDRLRALISAQDRLRTTLAESGLPEVCHSRVMSVVCGVEGTNIPLTEAGRVDDERFTGSIAAAIQAEKVYIAGLAESAGTGVPRGLGGSDTAVDLSEAALADEMESVFAEIGLSADVAKTAAKGRVTY